MTGPTVVRSVSQTPAGAPDRGDRDAEAPRTAADALLANRRRTPPQEAWRVRAGACIDAARGMCLSETNERAVSIHAYSAAARTLRDGLAHPDDAVDAARWIGALEINGRHGAALLLQMTVMALVVAAGDGADRLDTPQQFSAHLSADGRPRSWLIIPEEAADLQRRPVRSMRLRRRMQDRLIALLDGFLDAEMRASGEMFVLSHAGAVGPCAVLIAGAMGTAVRAVERGALYLPDELMERMAAWMRSVERISHHLVGDEFRHQVLRPAYVAVDRRTLARVGAGSPSTSGAPTAGASARTM